MYFLITVLAPGDANETLIGFLVSECIAPVVDYQLVLLNPDGQASVATLLGYPRWSEPAFGLLARLLNRLPETAVGLPLSEKFEVKLRLGETIHRARIIESLAVSAKDGVLTTVWGDRYGLRIEGAPCRQAYKGLAELLMHAARIATWGADIEPPSAPPLTAVPIHQMGGKCYVIAADIPPHARRHFTGLKAETTGPLPGTYAAEDWLAFIAADGPSDTDSRASDRHRVCAPWTTLH